MYLLAAAFGRLCVETICLVAMTMLTAQPPSGGCVLKPFERNTDSSGGRQPPSGGCVLKLLGERMEKQQAEAAAFGRLCVETIFSSRISLL